MSSLLHTSSINNSTNLCITFAMLPSIATITTVCFLTQFHIQFTMYTSLEKSNKLIYTLLSLYTLSHCCRMANIPI